MYPTAIFGIIHGSHCTISAKPLFTVFLAKKFSVTAKYADLKQTLS